jgi:hypothetical protein
VNRLEGKVIMEKLILSRSHMITLHIIRIIHSRKMSCAEYVADMGEKRNKQFLWEH